MKKLKACVVGVGFIGVAHIEALRRLGNVDVVAIADPADAQKKADELCVPKAYSDYKEMLDIEKPDTVHICVPNNLHYEIAMYAMERGICPICEKPFTTTVEEARELVAFAKEKNLVYAINFICRYYPQVKQMKHMIQNGELGDLFTIHGGYIQDWLLLDTDYSWRLESAQSGSSRAFSDIGSHWIDLVESVTGQRVVEVLADFEIFHKTRKKPLKPIETYSGMSLRPEDYAEVPIDTEDYCTVLFHFDGGAHGCCNISQVYAGRKNQMIVSTGGSKAAVHWDSEDSNELWIGHRESFNEKATKDPSTLNPETGAFISYPGGHVEGFPDTFKQHFKCIYKAVAEGDTASREFATFEDGLRDMLICEAVVKSSKDKCWTKIGE